MSIDLIIRTKRKELGYTQEQVADYLGVSAPAVNKWEKGNAYPDISLLAPLARLLKTDVNELLCFREELTPQEIAQFGNEVRQVAMEHGFDAGLNLAEEKLHEYPHNGKLLHDLTLLLDGVILLSGAPEEEQKKHQEAILGFYERMLSSEEADTRTSAAFMLASKYIAKEEFEKAQQMLDLLPEHNAMDKRALQANLYEKQGDMEKAEEMHKRMLHMDIANVWNHLFSLVELELKKGNMEAASQLATMCSESARVLDLPAYNSIVPRLIINLSLQKEEESLEMIEELLKSLDSDKTQKQFSNSILPALLHTLETDERCKFLHNNKRYQQLISGKALQ